MFSNLIEAAVRLRFMVLCVLVGLGVFAALMIPKLNLDAFPDGDQHRSTRPGR